MKKFLFAMLLTGLMGCQSPSDPAVVATNKTTLASAGEHIGTLPDGRKIARYYISMGDQHAHWIYVVDGSISINHDEKQGKSTVNRTEVIIIDGIKYVPAEKQ